MQRDPVNIARDTLINWGVLDRARAEQIEAAAKQEAIESFKWAAAQPNCKPEDGLKHVFTTGTVAARQFG
jgi:acetoin:2,6-dichlorophenolindophenol oxidoreductase subunit alpha